MEEAVIETGDPPFELKARTTGQPSLWQFPCGSERYLGLYLTVLVKTVMSKFSLFILVTVQVVSRKRHSLQDYDTGHVVF